MTISLKADSSGTFGEVLVSGSPALKVSNGLLELPDGKDFFNQGNVVGTVSQSGGVPTGAVVERGSNANGEYIRFADGTQICTGRTGSVDIISGESAEFSKTLPAAFSGAIRLSFMQSTVHGDSKAAATTCGRSTTAPTGGTVYLRAASTLIGTAFSVSFDIIAIGRWF